MPRAFRLYSLPPELVREIVQIAATPKTNLCTGGSLYTDAVSLARVSYTMRQLAMPNLLNSVILSSHENVVAFFRALKMQHNFHKSHNRLCFPYPRSIKHFWCSRFYEPLMGSNEHYDYHLLFNVFAQAQRIGFHIKGIELLNEVFAHRRDGIPLHFCKNLTIAGAGVMRWNPLTATSTGAQFLDHLTHLTVLRPDINFPFDQASTEDVFDLIPESTRLIPFNLLKNVIHFAICLNTKEVDSASVLVVDNSNSDACGGDGIKQYIFGRDTTSCSKARVWLGINVLESGSRHMER
ncbi:hypothetical protein BJ165DRAFT_1525200 [Panaeolus papilionaceus]|nr:hypothetical protein BJ165DRAFT_1525200 [Panaeolus papilionaceus]